jgi:hypothetical protein
MSDGRSSRKHFLRCSRWRLVSATVRISSARTLQTLPLPSGKWLGNAKQTANITPCAPALNFQLQQFLEQCLSLVEHRLANPVRLPGATSIL